jgi:hypothetical protein
MKSQETPNPKCSHCLCYWKPDELHVTTSGLPCKTCKKCREQTRKDKAKNYEEYHRKIDCDCGGSYTQYNEARHIHRKISKNL